MQPVQNTSIQSPEYRDLPIEQLVESPTNPRKRYQQASLEELVQSFLSRGVLEPLLVRPVEAERFEIVAGYAGTVPRVSPNFRPCRPVSGK